jgi:hypothetical protein
MGDPLPRFKVNQTKPKTHDVNSSECEITVYAPRTPAVMNSSRR